MYNKEQNSRELLGQVTPSKVSKVTWCTKVTASL